MTSIRECVKANKGVLSIQLTQRDILDGFAWTSETENLKYAFDQTKNRYYAPEIIDELLKCDETVLAAIMETLFKNDHADIAERFIIIDETSEEILRTYIGVLGAGTEIPEDVCARFHQNRNIFVDLLVDNNDISGLRETLWLENAISLVLKLRLRDLEDSGHCRGATNLLICHLINGNAYQYDRFKTYIANNYPEALKYL